MPRGSSPKRRRQHDGSGADSASVGSAKSAAADRTYGELYAEAKRLDIKGRSMMRKADLARVLDKGGRA